MSKVLLAVFFGGGLGSVFRYLTSQGVQHLLPNQFPFGILFVNIVGSFLMGFLSLFLIHQLVLPMPLRVGILIGVLGGFTTFSSFSMVTVKLFELGCYTQAITNIVVSVVGCLLATLLGLWLANHSFN